MNNDFSQSEFAQNGGDDVELINRDYIPNMFEEDGTALPELPLTESSGLTPLIENEMNDYLSVPMNNQLVNYHGTNNNNNNNTATYSYPPMVPLSDPYTNLLSFDNKKLAPLPSQATRKRRENTAPKTRPAFVMKVWSMVNDPKNHEYIRWNSDGKTFQVYHREEFMKVIIPKYFKHNNFASFVRQLNMYGWHKVQDISAGTLRDDKDEIWRFQNPNFIKGREDLLDSIVRNKSIPEEESSTTSNTLQLILAEIEKIKANQIAVNEDLKRIRQDNKSIWHENYLRRESQKQQSQTLDQMLKFLATVYGNNNSKNHHIMDDEPVTPNNINSDGKSNNSPSLRPRLMLMDQEFKSPESTQDRRHSESSNEEIRRSYSNTPKQTPTDVNKLFHQLINDNSKHKNPESPRHSFDHTTSDKIDGIEQSLNKQGQSIQQVQNWIQRLTQQSAQNDLGLDDFDVTQFLQQQEQNDAKNKRTIEEIYDEDQEVKKRKKN